MDASTVESVAKSAQEVHAISGFKSLFAPMLKAEQRADGTVHVVGVLAAEEVDKTGEIFDYKTSKPNFEKWNALFASKTDGKSVGNMRAMHNLVSAGLFTSMSYDDEQKMILVEGDVIDPGECKKVLAGVYIGFSIGAKYVAKWKDADPRYIRWTADPFEGSLADNPCMPSATLSQPPALRTFILKTPDGRETAQKFQIAPVEGTDPVVTTEVLEQEAIVAEKEVVIAEKARVSKKDMGGALEAAHAAHKALKGHMLDTAAAKGAHKDMGDALEDVGACAKAMVKGQDENDLSEPNEEKVLRMTKKAIGSQISDLQDELDTRVEKVEGGVSAMKTSVADLSANFEKFLTGFTKFMGEPDETTIAVNGAGTIVNKNQDTGAGNVATKTEKTAPELMAEANDLEAKGFTNQAIAKRGEAIKACQLAPRRMIEVASK